MRKRTLTATAATLLAAVSTAAIGHHGWSGNTQEIQVTGSVVQPVDLSGPHGTMQIRATDGQVWDLTLAPAPRVQRAGLTTETLVIGDIVTATGMRNDNQARFEIKTRRVAHNDTNYDVYPPE